MPHEAGRVSRSRARRIQAGDPWLTATQNASPGFSQSTNVSKAKPQQHKPRNRDRPGRRFCKEARERFGIQRFRPGQREVLEAVFAGRSTLAILPTGGGKSLTYQLPALFLPRPVVVVSPLIALMQDQEQKAEAAEIAVEKVDSHDHADGGGRGASGDSRRAWRS